MHTYLDCIPCFVRQALEGARKATVDERMHELVLGETLKMISAMDMKQSPPEMGRVIHRCIREVTSNDDPYREDKVRFNKLIMDMYPELQRYIAGSADRIEAGIRLGLAGNIIDFGVNHDVTDELVGKNIDEAMVAEIDRATVAKFKAEVNMAESILYITDNCGEIVFDRVLIEQLPVEKITAAVRGSAIINDATIEDARMAGLTEIVEVIDNGSDAPGTILSECSEEFRRRFEQADMIIAKGQGNFETLSDEENVFFMLKAKCPMIAEHIGCEVGEFVFANSSDMKLVC